LSAVLWGNPAPAADPPTPEDRFAASVLLLSGHQREKAGDLEAALKDFNDAVRLNPQSDSAYRVRGEVWLKKGNLDRALADLTRSIELNPQSGPAALAFSARGRVWVERKDDSRALADFDEAVRLSPQSAFFYFYRAGCSIRRGDTARADADLTRYVTMQPDDPEGYFRRGQVRLAAREHHRSTFDFDEAIRLKPDHADAYYARGCARSRIREYDRAIADLTEAVRLRPKLTAAYLERAAVYQKRGNTGRVIEDYTEATRADPNCHEAYHMRAWLRATNPDAAVRDGALAAADARRACELTHWGNGDYIDTLAAAEAECGRFAEAIRYENQALGISEYAKSPQGQDARVRLKLYQEGKAYREGAAAEYPAAAGGAEAVAKTTLQARLVIGLAAGAGLLFGGFFFYRLGLFGIFRPSRPAGPLEAAAEPPPDDPDACPTTQNPA
jgi:tetratricopeptide (TPR) repeat protein